jgi:hypothetical protein
VLAQELMELELAEHVGAERHERTPERSGYRNGYRERPWDTRVGSIELQVPRMRDGSFFPSRFSDPPVSRSDQTASGAAPGAGLQQACHCRQTERTRSRLSARRASRGVRPCCFRRAR